ncbi:MAG: hypothetical protein CR967_00405 [Proteobacteria bacterium]|nr:MAG: hypothetical protein CR967_00405 [Pseudomonadota bacterium]
MPRKKRKSQTRKKNKSFFTIKSLFIILLILFLSTLTTLYVLHEKEVLIFNFDKINKEEKVINQDDNLLKEITLALKKQEASQKSEQAKTQDIQEVYFESNDTNASKKDLILEDNRTNKIQPIKKTQTPHKAKKPKLAIIIDDVAFGAQTRKIKQIPYRVTPSFMPPSSIHPNTPKLAKSFSIHMVHLPLEAFNNPNEELMTLKTKSSYKTIKREIVKIKSNFPKAVYYNNHTGSKFTSNLTSMDRLFKVFKEESIKFLDSKTTPHSKAKIVAKKYEIPILNRDVFLDNSRKPKDIKRQLRQAIGIAKRRGFAIAICHPYSSTLEVLKNAKPMFKGLDLVYISEI